jgi:hypothetical protein
MRCRLTAAPHAPVHALRRRPGDRVAGVREKRAARRSLLFRSFGGPQVEDPMRFELKVVVSVETVALLLILLRVLQFL